MSAATLLGTMAVGCSDNKVEKPSARNWDVAIEAVMEGGTRTEATIENINHDFSTEDRVYVYNATKKSLLDGCLKPSSGGSSATTLLSDGSLNGIVEVGDELIMTYIPFNWSPDEQSIFLKVKEFRYNPWYGAPPISSSCIGYYQTGEQSKIMNYDYAESHVMVESTKGGIIQVSGKVAEFTHLQSIFQLSFRFVDEGGNDIVPDARNIDNESLRIAFWDDSLQGIQDMISFQPTIMDGEIYLALPILPQDNVTRLIISIGEYEGSMNAPEGKFHNGKIYCPTEPIVMK